MDIPFNITVKNEHETGSLAKLFSKILKLSDIVLLNGELGTGKTSFVKSICHEFGIENVSSPSFAIVNEYQGSIKIYHFDFYRIKKLSELYDLGFEDYLNNAESITFIEWANLWPEILPNNYYSLNLDFVNDNFRKITITKK